MARANLVSREGDGGEHEMHVVRLRARGDFSDCSTCASGRSCRESDWIPYENRRGVEIENVPSRRRNGSEARVRTWFRCREPNDAKYFGIHSPAIGSAFPGRFSPSRRTDRRFRVQNSRCQAADLKFLLAHLAPSFEHSSRSSSSSRPFFARARHAPGAARNRERTPASASKRLIGPVTATETPRRAEIDRSRPSRRVRSTPRVF